jgi:type I restriction enzyme S subunit
MTELAGLPQGWHWATVDEILFALESGSRPKGGVKDVKEGVPSIGGEHILYSGDFDFSKIRYIPEEYYEDMRKGKVAESDVLVVKDGATTGKTGFVSESFPYERAAVNEHVFILRVFRAYTEPKYLFFWMQSPFGKQCVADNLKGTAQGGINISFAKNCRIPISPLPEQRRIVAEIETRFTRLDAGVAALERAQANLRRYKAAVLKATCEGRLVRTEAELARAEGRDYEPADQLLAHILAERRAKWEAEHPGERYKDPVLPDVEDISELPGLPKGWRWATAEQLSDETRSITYGIIKLGEPVEDGIPTLRSSNVRHLHLDLKIVKRVSPKIADNYRRTLLRGGEVLVTVRGTLGGVAVVPEECKGFNISREVAMIALIEPAIGPAVSYFIGSVIMQNWLLRRTKGIAYTGINIETLKRTPIPLPPPAEQRRIVAEVERRLSVVAALEREVEDALARTQRLRQSILKHAFEGRLVPQDPADEPAGELLKRIRASRERLQEEQSRRRAAERRQRAKQEKRREMRIRTSSELRELLRQLQQQSGSPVLADELFETSKLSIEAFHTLLREEVRAGHIREHREGYKAFLEITDESQEPMG